MTAVDARRPSPPVNRPAEAGPVGSDVVLHDVVVRFGPVRALAGASVHVPAGRLVSVLGPSGCGKSTLLRVVAGFVRPDTGTVSIGGVEVTGPGRPVPPERRGVGIVPQDAALFPHLTVAGNIAYGLRRGTDRTARVGELLDLVGLTGLAARRPDELSGGQQHRVALARALAPRPRVVLLDEPFSALDAGLRAAVRTEVREVLQHEGATAVLVTHDQDEALAMSDLVAVMREGRIEEVGTPEEVYHRPGSLPTARFVGDLVELAGVLGPGRVRTVLGEHDLHDDPPGVPGDQVVVGIRPEQLRLEPAGPAGPSGSGGSGGSGGDRHGLSARVEAVEFYGHDAYVTLGTRPDAAAARPQRLLARTDTSWAVGTEVTVTVQGRVLTFRG